MYIIPFLITKDSKLIAFQYKINHHILPTKWSLFWAGITESNICTYYKTENWLAFPQHWRERLLSKISLASGSKDLITLTEYVILHGYHNNIKNKQALNVTLLLAKYHIFSTGWCDDKLSFKSILLCSQNHLGILKQSFTATCFKIKFYSYMY